MKPYLVKDIVGLDYGKGCYAMPIAFLDVSLAFGLLDVNEYPEIIQ